VWLLLGNVRFLVLVNLPPRTPSRRGISSVRSTRRNTYKTKCKPQCKIVSIATPRRSRPAAVLGIVSYHPIFIIMIAHSTSFARFSTANSLPNTATAVLPHRTTTLQHQLTTATPPNHTTTPLHRFTTAMSHEHSLQVTVAIDVDTSELRSPSKSHFQSRRKQDNEHWSVERAIFVIELESQIEDKGAHILVQLYM
jgi:hypothetical protein